MPKLHRFSGSLPSRGALAYRRGPSRKSERRSVRGDALREGQSLVEVTPGPAADAPTRGDGPLVFSGVNGDAPSATETGPGRQATARTRASALILHCEDPQHSGAERPLDGPSIRLLRDAPGRLPTREALAAVAGHHAWILMYGSRGVVGRGGEPICFNGHPRSPSLTTFLADLIEVGITTDCLVLDFSHSLGWLPALRPLIGDEGLLLAVAARSWGTLADATVAESGRPGAARSPAGLARAILRAAERRLRQRFQQLVGSPHAVYEATERLLLRGGDDGLVQYGWLDTANAARDIAATGHVLAWLQRYHVGADRTIAVQRHDYHDADVSAGFLAEVERRLA